MGEFYSMTQDDLKSKYDIQGFQELPVVVPEKPTRGLVLLVGASGSGKSTILRDWFPGNDYPIDDKLTPIDSFDCVAVAEALLLAFGLRSIPTWFRPINTLSRGEFHRAECAIKSYRGALFIDEFTSTVDRSTAKSLSVSVRKHCADSDKLLVVASCHRDIIEWLQPDVIYDTDRRQYLPRGSLRRPSIQLEITPASVKDWVLFKDHHYLNRDIHSACQCYIAHWEEEPVAFIAVMHRCCSTIPLYYGESRIVVRPQYQGLGIGVAVSDAIASEYVSRGHRYFSKTAHPALGTHRNASPHWRATSTNGKARGSYIDKTTGQPRISATHGKSAGSLLRDSTRKCYSHEYLGPNAVRIDTEVKA